MDCTGMHHVGLWVDDVDGMIKFLTEVMGFRLLTRSPRGAVGAGERVFIEMSKNQLIEILSEPEVQPRPDFPLHPVGHIAGVPHLCFQVIDLGAWRQRLADLGYSVSNLVPEEGYMSSELGPVHLAFFEGPSGVGIELIEFEN